MKIKEIEKRDKYSDLARELKKLRNIRMTVIPIIIGALEMAPKEERNSVTEVRIRLLRGSSCALYPLRY